jgi:hypothetical protein
MFPAPNCTAGVEIKRRAGHKYKQSGQDSKDIRGGQAAFLCGIVDGDEYLTKESLLPEPLA